MGRPVKLLTIQEMDEIFREDLDVLCNVIASIMSLPPEAPEKSRARKNLNNKKYRRKKSLEKRLLKQAV